MMKQGSLAQLDQSTTLRTSGSGVRISHESPSMLHGVTVSTSDSESGSGGSNPSGAVYMEFVAERLRRKFVALVNAGSNPVKLPVGRFI